MRKPKPTTNQSAHELQRRRDHNLPKRSLASVRGGDDGAYVYMLRDYNYSM